MMTVLSAVASAAALVAFHQKHKAEFQATQALQAQLRLLTQAAAQRLKDSDVAAAQAIILDVLMNPHFGQGHIPDAIGVFQESRAADTQLAVLYGHGDRAYSAAYSPDGTRIITASRDKTARIWDAHLGKQLAVLLGHGDAVAAAAYSPDGTRIVTASGDKTARIWMHRRARSSPYSWAMAILSKPPRTRPTALVSSPPPTITARAPGMHSSRPGLQPNLRGPPLR
jgi:WD40 repeat protein